MHSCHVGNTLPPCTDAVIYLIEIISITLYTCRNHEAKFLILRGRRNAEITGIVSVVSLSVCFSKLFSKLG